MKHLPWIFALAAVWLMAAPFALGYAETTVAMRNDMAVGAVMLILTFLWGYVDLREHGWGIRVQRNRHQHS